MLLLKFSAGVALLLFGMRFMKSGLERAAQKRIRKALQTLTKTAFISFLTGTVLTALVQSSTAVTIMTIGFVNAGVLTFQQAVGIVLGTNVGTCVTAQLISFNLTDAALPAIGLGALMMILPARPSMRCLGQSIAGFGVAFLGIGTLSDSVAPLSHSPFFISLLARVSANPLLGVLAGTVFTALIHSSSTTTGVVIALSGQGLVDLTTAIAIILGSNVGTCITGVLAAVGTPPAAKQVAAAHVALNVIGVCLVLPMIGPFASMVSLTASSLPREIANAHTFFNLISSLAVLPFSRQFAALVRRLVPDRF